MVLRAMCTIPVVLVQVLLLDAVPDHPILITIPSFMADIFFIYTWKKHIIADLAQIVLALIMYQFIGVGSVGIVNSGIQVLKLYFGNILLFCSLERLLKEAWVLRETSEKSFKTFFQMLDEHQQEIFVISSHGKIEYFNHKAEKTLISSLGGQIPDHISKFISDHSQSKFNDQLKHMFKENSPPLREEITMIKQVGNQNEEVKSDQDKLLAHSKLPYFLTDSYSC